MHGNRRSFLKQLSAGLLLSATPTYLLASAKTKSSKAILYGARSHINGQHQITAMIEEGELLFNVPLPTRAHDVILRPHHNELLVFARRPEHFILVLNAQTGEVLHQLESEATRPLYGHGIFSKDGHTLFTTENDYQNKQSVIAVRDVRDSYKKLTEFPSGGIGAHELRLLSDGKTLVVANGGILTHPNTGRSKLNLDTMSPSLSYLDVKSGQLLEAYRLAKKYHQLSIRHLDITPNDEICFAMQYQGSRLHQYPLVGFQQKGGELQLASPPKDTLKQMKNYCGSVCVDASGKQFAVSSPRGNLITLWSHQGEYQGKHELTDGCGIATGATDNSFFFSNGQGALQQYKSSGKIEKIASNNQYRWDNHLLSTYGQPQLAKGVSL